VLAIDAYRRKDERDRGARHQYVEVDRAAEPSLHAPPLGNAVDALEECDGAARRVTRRRDGERLMWPWAMLVGIRPRDLRCQQVAQRRGIEQRARSDSK
jgi:hypothetical protein